MTDEQGRVLDMVSEGKITVEEAERLLAALGGTQGSESEDQHSRLGDALHREVISVVMEDGGKMSGEALRDETFTVGEAPRVVVKNDNGRVRCEVGDAGSVRVAATLRHPRAVKYSIKQEGDVVTVEAKSKGKSSLLGFFGHGGSADIVVTAPRNTVLEVGTANGGIEASGFESESSVRSTNGGMTLQDMTGGLEASSTNGKITLSACEGDLAVSSTNGRITVEEAKGSINASTVNGAVSFSGELVPGSRNELNTVNGPVEVQLLGEVSVRVDAACVHGSLNSHLPGLEVLGPKGRKLEGTVGDGEAELTVQTVNGSVRVN